MEACIRTETYGRLAAGGEAPRRHAAPALPKVVAVIPARGGSKGIPRKNAKPLAGKPLVAYSIEAALGARSIDTVVVSTDDEAILDIARHYPRVIPIRRPAEYAGDKANINDAVTHALRALEADAYVPDFVVQLYPTNPFRTSRMVDFLTQKGLEGYSPVLTVKEINRSDLRFITAGRNSRPRFIDTSRAAPPCYRSYGLYVGLSNGGCGAMPYFHVVKDEIQLIDIDYPCQFQLAERVLQNRFFDFDA